MIYEAYEARMRKIAAVLDKIRKYRVLIISVICAILALIAAFLGVKGMIIEAPTISESGYIYGDAIDFGGKALFGSISYEYKTADGDWSEQQPYMPGDYLVRAVSERSFGIVDYGDELSWTIRPRELTIYVEGTAVYGDAPNISAPLVRGDVISEFDYEYTDLHLKNTTVTINPDTLVIMSSDGSMDVSCAYIVTAESATADVSLTPRPIEIVFGSAEKTYDGTPLSAEWIDSAGDTVYGDMIALDSLVYPSEIFVGSYENKAAPIILADDGTDVTALYDVTCTPGTLTIFPIDIKVVGSSYEKMYDGKSVSESFSVEHTVYGEYVDEFCIDVDSGILINIIEAGVHALPCTVSFADKDTGEDRTRNYNISYEFGAVTISKRPLELTVSDETCVYSGYEHLAAGIYSVTGEYPLPEGENVTADVVGARLLAGEGLIDLANVSVYAEGRGVSTQNYEITVLQGKLTVEKRKINFVTPDNTKVYDGTPDFNVNSDDFIIECTNDGGDPVAYGDVFDYLYHGITNVSESGAPNAITVHPKRDGEDVAYCYEFNYIYGTLTVTPRPITVTAIDYSWEYDALPHHASDIEGALYTYTVADGSEHAESGLLELKLHQIKAIKTISTPITLVGTTPHTIDKDSVKIYGMNNEDLTRNYAVETIDGTLTVTPRPITATFDDGSWVYDGEYHNGNHVSVTHTTDADKAGLVGDHLISLGDYISPSIRDVGTVAFGTLDVKVKDQRGEDFTYCYELTVVFGTLEITPRSITVTLGSDSKVYDAQTFTYEKYEITSGTLVSGDVFTLVFSTVGADVGEYGNVAEIDTFIGGDGRDVKKNYDVTFVNGTLSITPRPLTVTTASGTIEYNSQVHDGSEFSEPFAVTSALPLIDGHTVSCTFVGVAQNVGKYDNAIDSVTITDANGDVTKNYNIVTISGTIEITHRNILIWTNDEEREYDGTPLVGGYNIYYVSPDGVKDLEQKISAIGDLDTVSTVHTSSVTNVWEGAVTNDVFIVMTRDGVDVSSNYNVDYKFGLLKINPRKLSVKPVDHEWIYDGTLHTPDELDCSLEFTAGSLVEGHRVEVVTSGSIMYVGTVPHTIDKTEKIRFFDGEIDVTENYLVYIDSDNATFTVVQAPLTVTTSTASKLYDGIPLTSPYLAAELPDSHTITAEYTGSQTVVGTSDNTISSLYVFDTSGKDVTDQFNITLELGTLTVETIKIQINTESDSKYYDGTPLVNGGYTLSGDRVLDGHTLTVIVRGSQTDVGKSPNTYTYVITDSDGNTIASPDIKNDIYDISTGELGELEVMQLEIVIKTASDKKIYDGEPLTNGEWTVEGSILPGHKLYVTVDGSQTEVGTSYNTFTYSIVDADGTDVHLIYTVVAEFGELTVTENPKSFIDSDLTGSGGGGGGGGGGDSGSGEILPILEFLADFNGTVLFRSYSYLDYTGTAWTTCAFEEDERGLYLVAEALINAGVDPNTIDVKLITDVGFLTAYYYTLPEGATEDRTQLEYTLSAYLKGDNTYFTRLTHTDEWAAFEREYRVYVYETYLNVPETTRASMLDILASMDVDLDSMTLLQKVEFIRNYVSKVAPYNKYPKIPEGTEDIAVWFLTDPDASGKCDHFATAATLLYRTLGIPARMAVGMAGVAEAGKWVTLIGDNAHAWVEVYVDGLGWITVDPTGSGGAGGNGGNDGTGDTTEKIDITVSSGSSEFEYDGFPKSFDEYELIGTLLDGHSIRVEFKDPSGNVIPGKYSNEFEVKVIDADGYDVTDRYNITHEFGTITVIGRYLYLYPYSLKLGYSGEHAYNYKDEYPDYYDSVWVLGREYLPEGYRIWADVEAELNSVGQTESRIVNYRIYDNFGNDVTAEFCSHTVVETFTAPLIVLPIKITVTTASAEKVYNAIALTKNTEDDYSITSGNLIDGHTITVTIDGRQVDVGESLNTVSGIVIKDKDGNDVTDCYEITVIPGTLTVKEG